MQRSGETASLGGTPVKKRVIRTKIKKKIRGRGATTSISPTKEKLDVTANDEDVNQKDGSLAPEEVFITSNEKNIKMMKEKLYPRKGRHQISEIEQGFEEFNTQFKDPLIYKMKAKKIKDNVEGASDKARFRLFMMGIAKWALETSKALPRLRRRMRKQQLAERKKQKSVTIEEGKRTEDVKHEEGEFSGRKISDETEALEQAVRENLSSREAALNPLHNSSIDGRVQLVAEKEGRNSESARKKKPKVSSHVKALSNEALRAHNQTFGDQSSEENRKGETESKGSVGNMRQEDLPKDHARTFLSKDALDEHDKDVGAATNASGDEGIKSGDVGGDIGKEKPVEDQIVKQVRVRKPLKVIDADTNFAHNISKMADDPAQRRKRIQQSMAMIEHYQYNLKSESGFSDTTFLDMQDNGEGESSQMARFENILLNFFINHPGMITKILIRNYEYIYSVLDAVYKEIRNLRDDHGGQDFLSPRGKRENTSKGNEDRTQQSSTLAPGGGLEGTKSLRIKITEENESETDESDKKEGGKVTTASELREEGKDSDHSITSMTPLQLSAVDPERDRDLVRSYLSKSSDSRLGLVIQKNTETDIEASQVELTASNRMDTSGLQFKQEDVIPSNTDMIFSPEIGKFASPTGLQEAPSDFGSAPLTSLMKPRLQSTREEKGESALDGEAKRREFILHGSTKKSTYGFNMSAKSSIHRRGQDAQSFMSDDGSDDTPIQTDDSYVESEESLMIAQGRREQWKQQKAIIKAAKESIGRRMTKMESLRRTNSMTPTVYAEEPQNTSMIADPSKLIPKKPRISRSFTTFDPNLSPKKSALKKSMSRIKKKVTIVEKDEFDSERTDSEADASRYVSTGPDAIGDYRGLNLSTSMNRSMNKSILKNSSSNLHVNESGAGPTGGDFDEPGLKNRPILDTLEQHDNRNSSGRLRGPTSLLYQSVLRENDMNPDFTVQRADEIMPDRAKSKRLEYRALLSQRKNPHVMDQQHHALAGNKSLENTSLIKTDLRNSRVLSSSKRSDSDGVGSFIGSMNRPLGRKNSEEAERVTLDQNQTGHTLGMRNAASMSMIERKISLQRMQKTGLTIDANPPHRRAEGGMYSSLISPQHMRLKASLQNHANMVNNKFLVKTDVHSGYYNLSQHIHGGGNVGNATIGSTNLHMTSSPSLNDRTDAFLPTGEQHPQRSVSSASNLPPIDKRFTLPAKGGVAGAMNVRMGGGRQKSYVGKIISEVAPQGSMLVREGSSKSFTTSPSRILTMNDLKRYEGANSAKNATSSLTPSKKRVKKRILLH